MKNYMLISMLLLGFHFKTKAQLFFENTNSTQTLWDYCESPSGNAYAVGNNGTILRKWATCDVWETLNSQVTNGLRKVVFVSDSVGFVCGVSGVVLKTSNAGNSWQALNSGVTIGLLGMDFTNDSTGFIAGGGAAGNQILRTADAGTTWTVVANFLNTSPFDLHFPHPDTGYMCGVQSQLYKSVDGGSSWFPLNLASTGQPTLTSVYFVNPNLGFVAGQNGTVRKTTDGGNTWDTLNTNSTAYFNGIYFHDSLVGFVAGNGGTLLKTNDGGNTWQQINLGITAALRPVRPSKSNVVVTVGNSGIVMQYSLSEEANVLFFETFCQMQDSLSTGNGWSVSGTTNGWRIGSVNNLANGLDSVLLAPYALYDRSYFGVNTSDSSVLESPLVQLGIDSVYTLSWNEYFLGDETNMQVLVSYFDGNQWQVFYENNASIDTSGIQVSISGIQNFVQAQRSASFSVPTGLLNTPFRFTVVAEGNNLQQTWAIDNIRLLNSKRMISATLNETDKVFCSSFEPFNAELKVLNSSGFDIYPIELAYGFSNQPLSSIFLNQSLNNGDSLVIQIPVSGNLAANEANNFRVFMLDKNPQNTDSILLLVEVVDAHPQLPNDTLFCRGDSILIAPKNTSASNYIWQHDSNASTTIWLSQAGTYTLEAHERGCVFTDSIRLQEVFPPSGEIMLDTNQVIVNNVIVFNSNATADSIQWNFGGQALPTQAQGAGPHSVVFPDSGQFMIELRLASQYCGRLDLDTLVRAIADPQGAVGIISANPNLRIYPNPASTSIQLHFGGNTTETQQLNIFDLSGKVLLTTRVYSNQILDVSSLPSGVYIVEMEYKNSIFHEKLVIH